MTARTGQNTRISEEADNLETMLDALPLYGYQRTKAWDTWAEQGMAAALRLLNTYKASYKATGHPLDAPIAALRAAYDAGDGPAAAGAIKQLITAVQAPAVTATTKLGDHQKPVSRKASGDPLGDQLSAGVAARARNGGM